MAKALAKRSFARRLLLKKDEMAERLSQTIKFKTVSYDYTDTKNKADYTQFLKLHTYLEEQFPKVHSTLTKHVVNKYSLIYHWKGTDSLNQRPYLLYAHMDVVPAIKEEWSDDPFSGVVKDG